MTELNVSMNNQYDIGINKQKEANEIPLIGFGTYRIKNIETLIQSINIGYRHFDTAELYQNEHLVRKAMDHINEKIYITTKVSKKSIYSNKIKESWNERLSIFNHVDLMLLHVPSKECRKDWNIFCDLYKQNLSKVTSIGVSNYDVDDLEQLKGCEYQPAFNQIEITPFCPRNELINYCRVHWIKIIAHTSLTNKTKFDNLILHDLSIKYNASVANILLSWAKMLGLYIIPKSESMDHMYENLYNYIELSSNDMKTLGNLDVNYKLINVKR